MSGTLEQIGELRKRTHALPDGSAKVALLQQAVELADVLGSTQLGYDLRGDLMSAASSAGRSDVMLVAFAWNLAQFDRDPTSFDRFDMLWRFKWVHAAARAFPDVPRARLEALLDDMERRHREYGSTLKAAALIRRKYSQEIGDVEGARAAHRLYRKRKRDQLSDCVVCEISNEVWYLAWSHQWKRAADVGLKALDAGLRCGSEPHFLLGNLLMPLFRLGRIDEARALQSRGYPLVDSGEQFLGAQADHLDFLVLIGDLAQAKRLVERHAPASLNAVSLPNRFYYLEAMLLWAERLLALGTTAIKVRLPDEMPGGEADGKTDLIVLRDWLLERVLDIGGRFDARNGTDGFHRRRERQRELLELARSPFAKSRRGDES